MIDDLLGWLVPHHCLGCRKTGTVLCDCCKNYVLKQHKTTIGQDLAVELGVGRVFCLGWRQGLLKQLVDNYKFQLNRELARALAKLLSEVVVSDESLVVISLPTTRQHNRQRGFDHMRLVARKLAQHRGWRTANLLRRHHQISQRGLSRSARLTNAKGLFYCPKSLGVNTHYLLIDDVYTTGATLQASIAALHQAGARRISVAIIARQPDRIVLSPSEPDLTKLF